MEVNIAQVAIGFAGGFVVALVIVYVKTLQDKVRKLEGKKVDK